MTHLQPEQSSVRPVIIGVGQYVDDGSQLEPVDLLMRASKVALEDSGVPTLSKLVTDCIIINILSWRYRDPGSLLAHKLGLANWPRSYHTTAGGQSPITALAYASEQLAENPSLVFLIGGAESSASRAQFRRTALRPPWSQLDDTKTDAIHLGSELDMASQIELQLGLVLPINTYALVESRIAANLGRSIQQHTGHIAQLWSDFSKVAASNPHANIRMQVDPDEIAGVSVKNRMVSTPYTKLLCSNSEVDMAASFIVTTEERAHQIGITQEKIVYLHKVVTAVDSNYLSERPNIERSIPISRCGQALEDSLGIAPSEYDLIDLYSCFPSAVEVSSAELGIDPTSKVPTITGGLTFAGGPWNNYVSHAVSSMVARLRSATSSFGLLSANGGILSKHALAAMSCQPPQNPFSTVNLDHLAASGVKSVEVRRSTSSAEVEAHTINYDRSGQATRAYIFTRSADGARIIGTSADPRIMEQLLEIPSQGIRARIDETGNVLGIFAER